MLKDEVNFKVQAKDEASFSKRNKKRKEIAMQIKYKTRTCTKFRNKVQKGIKTIPTKEALHLAPYLTSQFARSFAEHGE